MLNIVATYGRSWCALVCGLFISRLVVAALGSGLDDVVGGMTMVVAVACGGFVAVMRRTPQIWYNYAHRHGPKTAHVVAIRRQSEVFGCIPHGRGAYRESDSFAMWAVHHGVIVSMTTVSISSDPFIPRSSARLSNRSDDGCWKEVAQYVRSKSYDFDFG